MAEFSIVKRGYDAKEVDEYIVKNNAYLEDKLKEQRLRINELKMQNMRFAARIKELKNREDDVKNALIAAQEKSKEIMSAAKLKYALEGRRLCILQTKWKDYFEKNRETRDNDDYKLGEAYYIKIESEIRGILRGDFGIMTENNKARPSVNDEIIAQYKSETKRLTDGGADADKESYGELIKRIKKEFGGEFAAELTDGAYAENNGFESEFCGAEYARTCGGECGVRGAAPEDKSRNSSARESESNDFSNLASIKPEQSLEELCRDLGL
ncbi:MAG: DivIVA domain-containing protein [Clostridiales bacterium]|jgi:cell division septum initiation protein DivIVA|nr:DivIVA domain-containing protein [Clostridiales bacterium]